MKLDELLSALTDHLDDKSRRETMRIIHGEFDKDFVDSLGQWIGDQKVKNGTLLNALVYETAYRIFLGMPEESEACRIVKSYGDYMHQALHRMYAEHGDKPEILALREKQRKEEAGNKSD
jgi:hypothetical protein